MRILLTGRGGFCGRHFTSFAAARAFEVVSAGASPSDHPRHHLMDLADSEAWARLLKEERPDCILHLAGAFRGEPELIDEINAGFANALITGCLRADWQGDALIFIGSGAEYGFPHDLPLTEASPCSPVSAYGISKLKQTQLGLEAAASGLPAAILRPFNLLGPGLSPDLFIGAVMAQLKPIKAGFSEAKIEVGDLSAQRDFVDVRDFCEAVCRLMQTPEALGKVYNLCSGIPVSMQVLLDRLLELSGLESVQVCRRKESDLRPDVPMHYGSGALLKQFTGFSPQYSCRDSLGYIVETELGAAAS